MISTTDLCFVDTNVLVYAHDVTSRNKRKVAVTLLRELWETRTGVVSTQVLQELYVTLTRKPAKPVGPDVAASIVRALGQWRVETITLAHIEDAMEMSRSHRISFWDSLIFAAALTAGARWLLTEDLQDGFRLDGLTVVNPFLDGSPQED